MIDPDGAHHPSPMLMPNMFWNPPVDNHQNMSFRSSTCAQVPVSPRGQQNESLSSAARKGLMIADNAIFGNHQAHFNKNSSKAEKAAVVAGETRTIAGQTISAASYLNIATWAGNKLANGSIPADHLTKSFQALGGIGVATQSLSFLKSAGQTGFHAVKDISAHKQRGETQELLKDYNPETRDFKSLPGSREKKERLTELLGKKGPDLARSKKQTAADRLTEVKDLAHKGAGLASSALFLASHTSAIAAQAAPGVGIVVAALSTVSSAVKTGIQIVALNNLAKAESATKDPLLKALSGHIKQERTSAARKNLVNTAVQALSTGVGIGLAASGVGAPAALIASGAIGTAVSISTLAFDGYHNRDLAKKRAAAGAALDTGLTTGVPLASLAKENIGVAEKAFLTRLRTSTGTELSEAVKFLRDFGVTDNTIKKLQLSPESQAIKTLQSVLYNDKVKFKGFQLKQTAKTLAHVSGLTALGKRMKAGAQWLKNRLQQHRDSDGVSTAGHNIFYGPVLIKGTKNSSAMVHQKRGLAIRPARQLHTHFTDYQYARFNPTSNQQTF